MPVLNMQMRDGNNISSFNLHRVNQTLATNAQLLPHVNQAYITKHYFEANKRLILIYGVVLFMCALIIAQYSREVRRMEGYLATKIITKSIDLIKFLITMRKKLKSKPNAIENNIGTVVIKDNWNLPEILINIPDNLENTLIELKLDHKLLSQLDNSLLLTRQGKKTLDEHNNFFHEEVTKKLTKMSLDNHPDKFTDPEEKSIAHIKQTKINTLKDVMIAIHEVCINDDGKIRKYSYYNNFPLSQLSVINLKNVDMEFAGLISMLSMEHRDNRITSTRNDYIEDIVKLTDFYKAYINENKPIDWKEFHEISEEMSRIKILYLTECDDFIGYVRRALHPLLMENKDYTHLKFLIKDLRKLEEFYLKQRELFIEIGSDLNKDILTKVGKIGHHIRNSDPKYILPVECINNASSIYEQTEERYTGAYLEYHRIRYVYKNLYEVTANIKFTESVKTRKISNFIAKCNPWREEEIKNNIHINIEFAKLSNAELWTFCFIVMKLCTSFNNQWDPTKFGKDFQDYTEDFIKFVKEKSTRAPSSKEIEQFLKNEQGLIDYLGDLIKVYESRIKTLFPEKLLSPQEIVRNETRILDEQIAAANQAIAAANEHTEQIEQKLLKNLKSLISLGKYKNLEALKDDFKYKLNFNNEQWQELEKSFTNKDQTAQQLDQTAQQLDQTAQQLDQALKAKISRIEKSIAKGKDKYTQEDLEEEINNEPKLSDQEYERLSKLIQDRDNKPDICAVTLPSTSASASNNSADSPSNNLDSHGQQEVASNDLSASANSSASNSVRTRVIINSQNEDAVASKSPVQGRANASN